VADEGDLSLQDAAKVIGDLLRMRRDKAQVENARRARNAAPEYEFTVVTVEGQYDATFFPRTLHDDRIGSSWKVLCHIRDIQPPFS
jgi:hypothetical protein